MKWILRKEWSHEAPHFFRIWDSKGGFTLSIAPTSNGFYIDLHTGVGYILASYKVKTQKEALLVANVLKEMRLKEYGVEHKG